MEISEWSKWSKLYIFTWWVGFVITSKILIWYWQNQTWGILGRSDGRWAWEDRHRVFTLQITSEPSFILCVHRSPIIFPEKITAHNPSLQPWWNPTESLWTLVAGLLGPFTVMSLQIILTLFTSLLCTFTAVSLQILLLVNSRNCGKYFWK